MLYCLRLDSLVGSNDEHHRRNAAGTCEHVADEEAVTRYVDEDDAEPRLIGGLHLEGREAEVDGDAAALLFRQPIGVNSCEGAYKSSLAVIDVTSGPNDNRSGSVRHAVRSSEDDSPC